MWIRKTMMLGEKGRARKLLQEGIQAMSLYVRAPDLPAVERAPTPLASRVCGTQ
jgi:hypothetical protein